MNPRACALCLALSTVGVAPSAADKTSRHRNSKTVAVVFAPLMIHLLCSPLGAASCLSAGRGHLLRSVSSSWVLVEKLETRNSATRNCLKNHRLISIFLHHRLE